MLKRLQRQRREYLYTKSLEGADRVQFEKKRRIRQALEEGKPIPTELRNEEHELRRQIDLEDQERQGASVFPYGRYPPSHAIPTRACGMQCSSSFACL